MLLAGLGSVALAAPKKNKKKTTPAPAADKDKDKDKTAPADTNGGGGSGSGSAAATEAVSTTPDAPTGMGSGSGSASAPVETATKTEPSKDEKEPDVDSLRQEYLSLRDELFKSRARANAVASQLYSTRITIKFNWSSGRYYGVSKASVRLDGATVYEDAGGGIAADDGVRFDGYVAPGRHLVTFHVEATGKDDDTFTSSTESQVVVKAVAQKDLVVAAKAHDSGDIAYEWKKSEHGNYGLGIDVSVKTAKPAVGDVPAPKGKK
jgi:3-hydroxymyristoyl/3-hydroxydecanoyl-(acyl carrier protein) dehydratase